MDSDLFCDRSFSWFFGWGVSRAFRLASCQNRFIDAYGQWLKQKVSLRARATSFTTPFFTWDNGADRLFT